MAKNKTKTIRAKRSRRSSREKDFKLPMSRLAQLWDMGYDINLGPGRPTKPYSQVEWIWICVNLIIDVCSSIQLMLSNTDEEVIESGPAFDFLFNNKSMPFSKLMYETVGFYSLYREVYWIFLDKDLISPKSIIIAGPDQCKPVVEQGVLVGYRFHAEGGRIITLFLEDVWPITNFNPDKSFRGIGPLTAGELSISSNYQATQYNEATLANGARIGTLLTAPAGVRLDEDERRALIAQFESVHKGARNAGKTYLATGGLDVKTIGQTMVELQMVDLRKFDASTICALFRIPPELVSLNPEAQYAHGPATQRFIMYTIAPLLSVVAQNITDGILRTFRFKKHAGLPLDKSKYYCGSQLQLRRKTAYKAARIRSIQSNQKLFAWFDIDSHPAIQEMERDKIEKVMKNAQYGVPLNQIITVYDLPFEPVPWGDDWWITMGLVPARFTLEAGLEGITGPSMPEGEGEEEEEGKTSKSVEPSVSKDKDSDTQKLRIWRNWVISWAGIEREYKESIRVFFVRQQRELLKKLKDALAEFSESSVPSVAKSADDIIARVVFDLKKENSKLKVINRTFFEKASELGIRQSLTEAGGLKGEALDKLTEQVKRLPAIKGKLVISTEKITKVNKVTQRLIARHLKQGLEAGEGLNKLSARIKADLGSNMKRARAIARTQTAGAVETGRFEGLKAAGTEKKGWLTSGDSEVRPAHIEAGRKYAEGIEVNEPFVIAGEFLMYPGDPAGSAANIVNCRCAVIAIAAAGKSFGLSYYNNLKFYSYNDMQKDKEQKNARTNS